MKKLISITLSLMLCFSLLTSIPALAGDNITVTLNGKTLTFDVPPQIISGSTMVPMRAIFEALGATVEWDATTKTITAKQGTKGVRLVVGSHSILTFTYDDSGNIINDNTKSITLGIPATIVNNRTLVPIRAISEGLGADVKWNGTTKTVTITSNISPTSTTKDATQEELIVATNAEFPPYEYVTEKGIVGQYDGIDIAIMKEVAQKLNRKLVIRDMEFDSIIPVVESGKADIAIAGITVTDERKYCLDFSDTYFTAFQTILVKNDNVDVKNVDSLKGKTVGVETGYTADVCLSEVEKSKNITVMRYTKNSGAVEDLKNGKLDAVVMDSPTANSFIGQDPTLKGVADNGFFQKEDYAMFVKKGNTELLNEVNAALKELKDSGRIDEIAKEVGDRLASTE